MRLLLALTLCLGGCAGQLGTTQVGGCLSGEHQLRKSGTVATAAGLVTLTVPPGTNAALCVW